MTSSRPELLPGSGEPLTAGELVILTDRKGRRYLVTLQAGAEWHSHAGSVRHDDLIGGQEGSALRTSKGMEITVFRPLQEEYVLKMKRGAQVVYPKDQAMIVAAADIRPGCTVIEAGTGSGALTLALLAAVGDRGRVISFEARDDHHAVGRANIERFLGSIPANLDLRVGDVATSIEGLHAHRIVLDLLEPWTVVAKAGDVLAPGGVIVAYTPTVPQVMRFSEALLDDTRFAAPATSETLVRPWDVDGLAVRPAHRMVAHTAFLTTARRVLARQQGGPSPPRRRPSGVVWRDGAGE